MWQSTDEEKSVTHVPGIKCNLCTRIIPEGCLTRQCSGRLAAAADFVVVPKKYRKSGIRSEHEAYFENFDEAYNANLILYSLWYWHIIFCGHLPWYAIFKSYSF